MSRRGPRSPTTTNRKHRDAGAPHRGSPASCPDVVSVRPLEGFQLRLRFEDGTEGDVDVAEIVREFTGVFEPVQAAVKCAYDQWGAVLARVIREAQAAGEIGRGQDPDRLANVLGQRQPDRPPELPDHAHPSRRPVEVGFLKPADIVPAQPEPSQQ